jgi:hypothetical protein
MIQLERAMGPCEIGAWERDKPTTLRLQQTMMRCNKVVRHMKMSPLAQRSH